MENLYSFYSSITNKFPTNVLMAESGATYTAALQTVRARAAALQAKGYMQGDVIALLAKNCPEWVITYMAITSIGAIAAILDTNLTTEMHQDMLRQAEAKAIFVSEDFEHPFTDVNVLSIDLSENIGDPKAFKKPGVGPEDISTLLFTSGTTNVPKIVGLTHANIFKTAMGGVEHLQLTPDHVFLALLPLYHVYGLLVAFLAPFASGARIVFQPSLKGQDILKSLQTYKVTMFPAVPQIWELFFNRIVSKLKSESPLKYNFFMFFLVNAPQLRKLGLTFLLDKVFKPIHDNFGGNMRLLVSGGARLKRKYFRYYNNMGFTLIEGYGLSETTAIFCAATVDNRKAGSVGKATPGNSVEIRNINEDGIGEIWVKGVSVFPGYYKNPAATKEVFDANGWFNTGDLGYMDKEHNLSITGRKKNVIVLDSGKNVYPEDIETYYQTSSELISEITVFGKQVDGKETLYAVIVPTHKTKESYAEIKKEMKRLNHGLPTYKIITDFAISFDALPITSTKKVILREVLRKLKQGIYQVAEKDPNFSVKEITATTPEMEQVLVLLRKKLKTNVLYVNETLKDFDLDSLDLVELMTYLETTLQISIDADTFIKTEAIPELVNYILACPKKSGATISDQVIHGTISTKPTEFLNPLLELMLFLLKVVSKTLWRLKINDRAKLLNVDNEIIIANHQSYLDAAWIVNALPYQKRKDIYIASKKELRFLKYMFPGIRIIFVERKGNFIPALKASADLLRQGKTLIIFPEGTRTATGKLQEFKSSVAFLAKNLHKTIIPITINGAFDIYPRQKILPRFLSMRKGSVTVHDRIDPDQFKTQDELNKEMYRVVKQGLERQE